MVSLQSLHDAVQDAQRSLRCVLAAITAGILADAARPGEQARRDRHALPCVLIGAIADLLVLGDGVAPLSTRMAARRPSLDHGPRAHAERIFPRRTFHSAVRSCTALWWHGCRPALPGPSIRASCAGIALRPPLCIYPLSASTWGGGRHHPVAATIPGSVLLIMRRYMRTLQSGRSIRPRLRPACHRCARTSFYRSAFGVCA
jgi:hypothetical protein